MVDAHFGFMICDIPNAGIAQKIATAIENLLLDEFEISVFIYPDIED